MKREKNKKNILISCILIIGMMVLSGCESLNYTSEQEDIIANYAANLILRHDANYKYDYITEEETTTIEENTTITEPSDDSGSENTTTNQTVNTTNTISTTNDISAAFQLPAGITAEYADYDVVSQYPQDDNMFVMKALENNKLLIVKFKVSNTTSQDIAVNMMSATQKFKGIVNDSKKYNAQLTLLLDALNTYEGTLAAGSVQTFVLVYQTQLDSKEDINSLSVAVTDSSGKESVLNLK